MRILWLAIACAGLSGCALDREIAQNEQRVCAQYGPPGSQPFFDCMVTLHGYRPGVPAPVFIAPTAPAPVVNCTTSKLGNFLDTTCTQQ